MHSSIVKVFAFNLHRSSTSSRIQRMNLQYFSAKVVRLVQQQIFSMQSETTNSITTRRLKPSQADKYKNYPEICPNLIIDPQAYSVIMLQLNIDDFLSKINKPEQEHLQALENLQALTKKFVAESTAICQKDVINQGSKQNEKKHKCKYCEETFSKAQSLGGHISKIHSHLSSKAKQPKKKLIKKSKNDKNTPKATAKVESDQSELLAEN